MHKENCDFAPHKIFLVHEFPCVLNGTEVMIEADPALRVVGTATSGMRAKMAIKDLLPNLFLIGLMLSDMDGFELLRDIQAAQPEIRTLVFSFREEVALMEAVIEAGADGYVSMRATTEELVHAIHAALSGGVYLEPRIAGRYVRAPATETNHSSAHLSDREKEVITLVAKGYCNKQICGDLGLSIKTIETYRARALEKLGLGSRVELVELAMREGWINQYNKSAG